MADWIQVKLNEHEMASYHLAAKMGIASALVNAWQAGGMQPEARQVAEMVAILGKYCRCADTQA